MESGFYRLLDLGFEKDVSSILTAVKKALFAGVRCQTVLLSATLNEGALHNTTYEYCGCLHVMLSWGRGSGGIGCLCVTGLKESN